MIQFFSPDILTALALPESDSKHAVRVLRLQEGDRLQVVDGRGNIYTCVLIEANPHKAKVQLVSEEHETLPWAQQLVAIVAPTKHMDRMEWLTEKLTEIGVNRIIPMLTARSERREIKTERLEKIAVSAMKQSLKATCPFVSPLTPIKQLQAEFSTYNRFVGYCDDATVRQDFAKIYQPGRDTVIMIGPEGDFTSEEINALINSGWQPVTFGDTRLRTETAALYGVTACHVLDNLNKF